MTRKSVGIAGVILVNGIAYVSAPNAESFDGDGARGVLASQATRETRDQKARAKVPELSDLARDSTDTQ